jgi:hypothetical protein
MGQLFQQLGRSRAAIAAALIVLVLSAGGIAVLAVTGGGSSTSHEAAAAASPSAAATATATPTATPTEAPTPIAHAGILDGVPMTDDEWAARKDLLPLAVMIDNTSSAVPHAGLNKADLVYEAFVEGGITRLMAVFWRQDADKVIPVRSARTPFVVWVSELAAMYGHAGGAITDNDANAIGQIEQWGIRDLNAFSPVSGNYYYRDPERYGPYDLGTSTGYLREAAAQLGYSGPPTVSSWRFREPGETVATGEPAGGIAIDYEGRLYAWQYIQWKWDPASGRYLRFQFGGPEVDAVTGEQLGFSTVIVMNVKDSVVDDVGHVVLEQIGSGPATVFTGGEAHAGTWKKDSREGRTRFYGADGQEIAFERGPIFIEAIGERSTFSFTADAADLPPLPEYTPPPPGSNVPEPADEPTPTEAPQTATPVVSATPRGTSTPSPSSTPEPSTSASPSTSTPVPRSSTATVQTTAAAGQ